MVTFTLGRGSGGGKPVYTQQESFSDLYNPDDKPQPYATTSLRGGKDDIEAQNKPRPSSSKTPKPPLNPQERLRVNKEAYRSATGVALLFVCIAAFTLQTLFANYIQDQMKYHKPYFILWISHSLYMVLFPIQLAYEKLRGTGLWSPSLLFEAIKGEAVGLRRRSPRNDIVIADEYQELSSPGGTNSITTAYIFKLALFFAVLFTIPGYMWYVSVTLTTMANLTAIYNTAALWAGFFSILLLREKATRWKVLSVTFAVGGVAIMSIFKEASASDKAAPAVISGNFVAFIGAVMYGLYEVLYKKYAVPILDPSIRLAQVLTSLIGLVTFVLFWIPIPILHASGAEVFQSPSPAEFGLIIVMAIFGMLFNSLIMLVIALTTPVFAAVGIMITIPLMAIVETAVSGALPTLNSGIGCALVCISFAVNLIAK